MCTMTLILMLFCVTFVFYIHFACRYKGQFVGCYVGESLTKAQADARERNYIDRELTISHLVFYAAKSTTYAVDATRMGNAMRFVNHSCDPNLEVKTVFTRGMHQPPHLAFFCRKDVVLAGTELTWQYTGRSTSTAAGGGIPCKCGAANCIGHL